MKPVSRALGLAVVLLCALSACSRKAGYTDTSGADRELSQLPCGSKTYRVSADRIDDEVRAACERAQQSEAALEAYRGTLTRFTCKASDGHVTSSVLVPRAQYDDYDRNCRQYLSTEKAFHSNTADIGAHQAALRDFIAANNALTKKHLDDDNALFHQRRADQAAVATLIKARGGSIEISN